MKLPKSHQPHPIPHKKWMVPNDKFNAHFNENHKLQTSLFALNCSNIECNKRKISNGQRHKILSLQVNWNGFMMHHWPENASNNYPSFSKSRSLSPIFDFIFRNPSVTLDSTDFIPPVKRTNSDFFQRTSGLKLTSKSLRSAWKLQFKALSWRGNTRLRMASFLIPIGWPYLYKSRLFNDKPSFNLLWSTN